MEDAVLMVVVVVFPNTAHHSRKVHGSHENDVSYAWVDRARTAHAHTTLFMVFNVRCNIMSLILF